MKKFFKILLALQFLLCVQQLSAQRVEWIKQFGGRGVDNVTSYIKEKSGNYLLFGRFQDSILLGSHILKTTDIKGSSFIAKIDTLGNVIWANSYGQLLGAYSIDTTDNSLYVKMGKASGSDWYYYLNSALFKVNTVTGEIIWSHTFDSNSGFCYNCGIGYLSDYAKVFQDELHNTYLNLSINRVDSTYYDVHEPYYQKYIFLSMVFSKDGVFSKLKNMPDQKICGVGYGLIATISPQYYSDYSDNYISYISVTNTNSDTTYTTTTTYPGLGPYIAINKNKKINAVCLLNASFAINQKPYYSKGGTDLIITQFNEKTKLEWAKQIGGRGNERLISNNYVGDTLSIVFTTTDTLTIDTIKINLAGKYNALLDSTGKCFSIVKVNDPYSLKILNTSIILNDEGSSYFFGNIENKLDTLISKGNSDIYFAKVSCKPAFLKTITGETKVCKGKSLQFSTEYYDNMVYTWETDKKSTIDINGKQSVSIRFDTTGTYRVKVTPSNGCGVGDPIYLSVNVIDKPEKPSVIVGDTVVCSGIKAYSVSPVASGLLHWTLDSGATIVPDKNNATINWHTPGLYTLRVSEYNECGDGLASEQMVLVQSKPEQPSAITGNTAVCRGSQTYTIATQTATTYEWFINDGGQLTGAKNKASVNWTIPGTHTLLVTANNTCGSSVPQTLSVLVKDVPARAGLISGTNKTCVGRNVYYTDKTTGVQYSWSVTGGGQLTASDNAAEINWAIPGTFTLKVTQANECGAGAPTSLVVKVLDVPTMVDSIVGLSKVCQGQQLYAVAQRADEEYKWDLTAGGSLLPKSNTATVGWSAAGAYTLSVSPFNQCGTGKSVSKVVTVSAATSQVGAIVGKDNPCLSTETYTVNNIAGLSYQWKLDGGGTLTENANNATVVWNKTGVHSLLLTTSDNCSISLIAQVIDKPLTPSQIVGNSTVCLGDASYQVEATPLVQYTWALSDGGTLTPYNNAASIVWEKAGIYELQVLAYNQCGNSEASKMQVKTLQAPQTPSLISGNDTVCISSESYAITPQADVTYNWWLNNAGGILTTNNNKTDVAWQYAHENVLNVSVNNVCGTSAIRSLPVVVKTKPSTVVLFGDSLACLGKSVYYLHPQTGTQYVWGMVNGGTITFKHDSAWVQWTSIGNHYISVTPKNFCGAGQATIRTIAVNSPPSLSESIVGKEVSCQGMEFYTVTGKAGLQYAWSVTAGGSLVSLGNSAKIFWTGAGAQSVSLTPYNECGLGKSLQKTVTVKRIPDSTSVVTGLRSVCLGKQVYSVAAVNEISYSWLLPSGGTLSSTGNSASVNWTDKGFYTISVVPSNMCGTGPARSVNVQVSAIPAKPQFASNDTLVCAGQVCRLQVNELTANNYNWSLATPSAGTISANAAQASIVFKSTGLQNVQLTASNSCGTSEMAQQSIRVQSVPSIVTPITGRTTLCLGKATYHILNSNKNALTWNINGGGFLSPQGDSVQIDWFTAGQYKISVTPSNECGNGNTQTLVVQTVTKPQQPDAIQGVNAVCLHTAAQLSTSAKTDVSYIWLTDTSGTITAITNTASVVYRQGGTHTITLIPSNSCGQGPATTASLQVNEPPRTMSDIFGDSSLCINNNANYAVPLEQGVSYLWTINNNATINTNNNTATLVANKAGDFQMGVQIKNQCGTVSLPAKTVRVKTVPTAKLSIVGDSSTCLGNTQYRVANNGNITLWNINGGGAIESKQNTALVNWNSPGVYQISAQENNLCGSGPVVNKSVEVIGAPALPVGIDGPLAVCTGSTQQYSTRNLPNILYRWEIVGRTADTAYKAIHSNVISLAMIEAGAAQINVSTYNQCGQSQKRYLDIAVQAPLAKQPFSILGDSVLCIHSTATYSTSLVNDFDWRWTIDSALTRGTFKNSAQVEWSKAGKFTLAATPYNSCGTGDTAYFGVQVEVPLQKPVIEYRGDSLVVVTKDSITWYKNNIIQGDIAIKLYGHPSAGQYMVQTHNSCGSSPFSDSSYITSPFQLSLSMRLFPNPTFGNYVIVELPVNYVWTSLQLINSEGQVFDTYLYKGSNRMVLSVESLTKGLYYIWANGKTQNIGGSFEKL